MAGLYLTDRALLDLDGIECYSVENWGQSGADKYLADLDSALDRLAQNQSLFGKREDYTGRLRFYRAREHVFVGDVLGGDAFIMAIWHGSMDFIDRLPKLEPEFVLEAELLASQIKQRSQN